MNDFDHDWKAQATRNIIATGGKALFEVYDGEDINDWHRRRIRIQLYNLLKTYEGVNEEYAKTLKTFIEIWENHKLYDGAVNVESIESLLNATQLMVARDWPLKNFFINLEASLSDIMASEGKLPRLPSNPSKPLSKSGAGAKIPSLFGPMKEKPSAVNGPEGIEPEPTGEPAPTQNEEE